MVKLAWRSLFRQRRRTALLIAVVAYATLAILFFWGFVDGFLNSIYQGQGRLVAAPVAIHTEAYQADPDLSHALTELAAAREVAAAHPAVSAVSARLDVPVLLRSPYASRGANLRGVEASTEPAVSDVPGAVKEGRFLGAQGEVVLGIALARDLDVRLGERLAVDANGLDGPAATGLTVVGFVDSGVEQVDETVVLAHIDDARTLSGVTTATSLAVGVPFGREEAVARALNQDLSAGVAAFGIMDQMGDLAQGLAAERLQMLPLGLLFSLFAAVAVTSSLVVSVMERTREFGVMLALGMSHRRLGLMVTTEAVLGSLLGLGVGLVLGYALLVWLAQVNVLGPAIMAAYGDFLSGLALTNDVRADVRLEYAMYAGFTVVLAAVFAVITPARRVARLVPSEAMRAPD